MVIISSITGKGSATPIDTKPWMQAGALRQHSERMREYGLAQWTLNHLARAMETLEALLERKIADLWRSPQIFWENGNAKRKELGKIF